MHIARLCALTLIGGFLASAQPAAAQDPVAAAPQAFAQKLDNAQMRVLEYRSRPGQKEAMHAHAAAVIYIISGGQFRSTTPDGRSQVIDYKTGDVLWREALTHAGENVGSTEIRAILIEAKPQRESSRSEPQR